MYHTIRKWGYTQTVTVIKYQQLGQFFLKSQEGKSSHMMFVWLVPMFRQVDDGICPVGFALYHLSAIKKRLCDYLSLVLDVINRYMQSHDATCVPQQA